MSIENLVFVKRTVDIRRNKNPLYKKDFLPQNWRAPFKAQIQWRPKPTYLFKWTRTGGPIVTAKVPVFSTYGAQARMPGRRRHKRKYTKKKRK